jgi:Tol biopolymer transport system component
VLPDGRHALVAVTDPSAHVDVVSLATGDHTLLLENTASARLVAGGYLLYVPRGRAEVVAVRFDPATLKISGDPVTVLDSIAADPGWTLGYFDVAPNGTLAYVPLVQSVDPDEWPELVLVARNGTREPRRLPRGGGPRFSPDGRRLVYVGRGRHGPDISVFDLDRGNERRLTGEEGADMWPIFSHDGRGVVFNSNRDRTSHLVQYTTPADGSGHPMRLPTDTTMHQQPFTWAAGGTELLYSRGPTSATGMDIWAVRVDGAGSARPLMQTAANETQPAVSPDGRWLAWMTDASGRPEVMVRRYPDGAAVPVSREGGVEPVWDPGGRELYFRDRGGTSVMSASFQPGDPPLVGAPRVLFTGRYATCSIWCRNFDVSPDGRRFVMERVLEGVTETGYWPSGNEIRIVPHWDRELEAKMRAAGTGSR